jgi:hypothetical protein
MIHIFNHLSFFRVNAEEVVEPGTRKEHVQMTPLMNLFCLKK